MRIALQKRNGLIVSLFLLVAAFLLPMSGSLAGSNEVKFSITDNPGRWFDTGVDIAGTRSLAIVTPGAKVNFSGDSNTVHTRTSLIFPTGAVGMPFNTKPRKGGDSVTLTTPGLYVFTCKIQSYSLTTFHIPS